MSTLPSKFMPLHLSPLTAYLKDMTQFKENKRIKLWTKLHVDIKDDCGTCGGNVQKCPMCTIYQREHCKDVCGIYGGDNSTCDQADWQQYYRPAGKCPKRCEPGHNYIVGKDMLFDETCLDDCNVINGDNSSCTDECGTIFPFEKWPIFSQRLPYIFRGNHKITNNKHVYYTQSKLAILSIQDITCDNMIEQEEKCLNCDFLEHIDHCAKLCSNYIGFFINDMNGMCSCSEKHMNA